jgi:hypothetical protein
VKDGRRAAAAGIAALVVYAALAAVSGRLGPLARRPLLDGSAPQPYEWVSPPPGLAATNITPKPSDFKLLVLGGHVPADTLPTTDGQVILIIPKDFTTPPPGTSMVAIKVTPLDPATLGPPPGGLAVLGNVYRIRGTFEPGGAPVRSIRSPIEVILTYPAHVGPPVQRTVIASTNGRTWKTIDSKESSFLRQIEGPVNFLGYVAATGPPTAATASSGSIWTIVAAVVALMLVAAGAAFVLRRRRSNPTGAIRDRS